MCPVRAFVQPEMCQKQEKAAPMSDISSTREESIFELRERFVVDVSDGEFGQRVLRHFLKRDAAMGCHALAQYALQGNVRLDGTRVGRRFRDRWFDATFNFCLTHKGI